MSFFLVLSTFLAIGRHGSSMLAEEKGKLEASIRDIDAQIEELQAVKRGYEAKAIRHENLGASRQFDDNYSSEARRHFQLAEQNRQIANQIQKDIDLLEATKQKLLLGGGTAAA
ncbi:MAG: hypothetical protein IT584_01885 [Chlamydiae bacterium]|nr:hypothetical protein [Chlamydiota bacterium]